MLDWIVAIAAIATALFTGITAYLSWRQHFGGLVHEWNIQSYILEEGEPATININLRIRNTLPHSIEAERIEVSGIPLSRISVDHGPAVPDDWPKSATALYGETPPGGVFSELIRVFPDWSKMSKPPLRRRFTKITGIATVVSSADTRKKIRLKRKLIIPAEIIRMSIAASAAGNPT